MASRVERRQLQFQNGNVGSSGTAGVGKNTLTQTLSAGGSSPAASVDGLGYLASAGTSVSGGATAASGADPFDFAFPPLQLSGGSGDDLHAIAAGGLTDAGGALPHADVIQRSFGADHDVGAIRAHVGGAATDASERMGANGYAMGEHVAFAKDPDVRLAAHEAAHVVQQRSGVQLDGGAGRAGDVYERHADEVAERVVAGRSAADLLTPGTHAGGAVVQREGDNGLRVAGGQLIADWATAVAQIGNLYTGVSTGVAWQKNRGVDLWYEQARATDPPPVWQELLINAVGFAASAGVAGYGAVLTARLVTSTTGALVRAAVAAGIDAAKSVAKSGSSAAVAAAMRTGGSDGRLVYREALKNDIDQATQSESDEVASQLSALASRPDGERWPGLQSLYDQLRATAAQALDIQHGSAVEAWMSASAQRTHGVDFQIGGTSLNALHHRGALTTPQLGSIRGHLQMNPDLSRLPAEHQAALERALGAGWLQMPVQRVTSPEAVAGSGNGPLSPTSTTGVIELHLNTPDGGADPSIDYVEIESAAGINEATRSYFVNSGKRIEEFAVPKLYVGSGFRIGLDETNSSATRTGTTGGPNEWLMRYGARKLGRSFDPADRELLETSAIAFLNHAFLTKTFAQLGVRSIGR